MLHRGGYQEEREREREMAYSQLSKAGVQLNKGVLVTGAVLVGVGGILGATGVLLGTSALLSATRHWVRHLDRPPTETAKLKWNQLKAAGTAGASAWQKEA